MPGERNQTQRTRHYMIPFVLNSRKGNIITMKSRSAVDRGYELGKGIDWKGERGNFWGWWKFSILCLWWWLYVYTSVKTHQITHLKLVNLLYVIPQLCWFKIKKWISVQSFQIITTCESVQFHGVLMFWEALSPTSGHIFFLNKQKILNNVKLRDGYRGVFFTVCARWYLEN